MLHAYCCLSKACSLQWLKSFLTENARSGKDVYIVLDQSGELNKNPNVKNLIKRFDCQILRTGSDAFFQNGPVERRHRSLSDVTKAIFCGADMDLKFWPHALQHLVRIQNAIPGFWTRQIYSFPYHWTQR